MRLRGLEEKDIEYMFEWMRDRKVTQWLHGDYSRMTSFNAEEFVKHSISINEIHFAIASDTDEYMGTVSIRHIDEENKLAEFAVVVRNCAMGKGYAWHGMVDTLDYAFERYDIDGIYWRVSKNNKRAIRFFRKHGFNLLDEEDIPKEIISRHSNEKELLWFCVLRGDDYSNSLLSRGDVVGCPIVTINTIPTIGAGELSFFESERDIYFDIKRIYYISKVPEGTRRGFHAHKTLKQILFCPYGKIQLILDDGINREEITLSDPSIAIVIDKPTWREMLWLERNSVLVVAASDYYDSIDYIRDYSEYLDYIRERRDIVYNVK